MGYYPRRDVEPFRHWTYAERRRREKAYARHGWQWSPLRLVETPRESSEALDIFRREGELMELLLNREER